ncbi:MAG TPA: hypothetical protein VF795_06010 [Desulfuromonadaceae bacterium]
MTLSLSTSLTHIDIDESCIIDIYRSVSTAIPSDPFYDGHPCEAYLCTGRENNQLSVYVAILDTVTTSPSIFTSGCDAKDDGACKQLMAEAKDFIASLGFALEKVNIDYGPAMRQVVIRNLRIMRPPRRIRPPQKQAPAEETPIEKAGAAPDRQPAPPEPPRPRQAPQAREPSPAAASPEGTAALAAELAALQTSFKRLAQEKADAEARAQKAIAEAEASARQAIADLSARLEQAEAARTKAEKAGRDAVAQHRRTEEARSREIDRLEAELKLAAEARQDAEEALAREGERHRESEARLSDEMARHKGELEEERTRHAEAEARLKEAKAGLRKAGNELEAETRRRSEVEAAAKKRERELRKELGALREEGDATRGLLEEKEEECRNLAEECGRLRTRLSEALDAVPQEQEARDAELVRETERMREASRALAGQLEEARREHDLARGELEAELRAANEKAESLAGEVERLAAEKQSWVSASGALKGKVRHAVERLRKEKQELEKELQRLREQLDDRPPHPSPVTPDPPGPVIAPSPAAESAPPAAAPAAGVGMGSPGSAFRSGDAVFRHDPKLTAIPCHSPDEVTEVHSSINAIQAGPFGRKPQVCLAYVLGVRHGRKTSVYLAWLLQEERSVLVCAPEQQPENAAGYADVMRDAIFYFESTGFMMDRLDLSKAARVQLKALEQSGICRFGGHHAPRASSG